MKKAAGLVAGLAVSDVAMTLTWRTSATGDWKYLQTALGERDWRTALHELAASAPAMAELHVTVMRPVGHARTVALPAMSRETAERVLARDWPRYVVGMIDSAHVASAERADRGRWRAAFVPAALLESIWSVADEHGWSVDVRTSDDAFAGAVQVLARRHAAQGETIVVLCDANGPLDAAHLRAGAPWAGRRFSSNATDVDAIAFARDGTPRDVSVVILGDGERATALARAFGADGLRATVVDTGLPPDASHERVLAALGTLASPLLPLRAPAAQLLVAHRARRITRWLLAATAAALLAAFAIERWNVRTDLQAISAARAELSPRVTAAVALRSQVDGATELASTLAEREARASRTSAVLATVALALPDGASLTALRVAGDSVTVEGESPHSAAVYEALRRSPALEQVRLAAPLRQERLANASGGPEATVEHFAFSARLRGGSE